MATYDEKLKELTDKAKPGLSPEEQAALFEQARQFNQQQQIAGGYNLLNTALLGLPDFLAKNITGEENYKKIQKEREELNPLTKGATDIAGTFAMPSGAILKGVGAMAKGLGSVAKMGKAAETADKLNALQRAGNWIAAPSKGVGQAILKGGAAGLEQTIPRIGIESATKGEFDPAKALLETGTSALVGGAAGGLLKGLSGLKGGDVIGEVEDAAAQQVLKSAGADSRSVRQFMNKGMGLGGPGAKLSRWGQERENLIRYVKENDLQNAVGRDKRLIKNWEELKEGYKKVDDAFEREKVDLGEIMARDASKPDTNWGEAYRHLMETYPEQAPAVLKKIQDELTKRSSLAGKRSYLMDVMKNAQKGDTDEASARFTAAATLRSVLDDTVDEVVEKGGDIGLKKLNQDYKALQFFAPAALRDEMKIPSTSLGSPTFIKGATDEMIKKGSFDIRKILSETLGKALQSTVGMGLNKAAAASLPLVKKVGEAVEGAPSTGISEALAARPGSIGQSAADAMTTGEAAAVEPQPEAKATPEEKEQAKKQAYSQAYFERMAPGLQELYVKTGAQAQGATWDEFVDYVEKKTDGFKPRRVAGLLYRDKAERKKFLRDLDRAEQLKGLDIDKALSKGGDLQELFGLAPEKGVRDELVNTLASLTASNADLGDEKARENINRFISKIMELPAKKRKEALFNALTNKDIADIKTMKEWGLI